jgi:hypothetical protein
MGRVLRQLRFWITACIFVIPLVVVLVFGGLCVRRILRYLTNGRQLAGIASVAVSDILGRQVHIGTMKISLNRGGWGVPNSIEFRDVAVAEGRTFASGRFFKASRAVIRYNFKQAFLIDDLKVPRVTSLDLWDPVATIDRSAGGKWNFASLIKPSKKPGRPFVEHITFQNADVTFRDGHFPHPPTIKATPFSTRVTQASGVLMLRGDGSVAFDTRARCRPDQMDAIHMTAVFATTPMRIDLHAVASRVRAPALIDRLVPARVLKMVSGTADLDINLTILAEGAPGHVHGTRTTIDVNGTAHVDRLAIKVPSFGAPIEGVTGTAEFTDNSVTANVAGSVAEAPTTLNGTMFNLGGQFFSPLATARTASTRLPPAPVAPALALSGTIDAGNLPRFIRSLRLSDRLKSVNPDVRNAVLHATGGGIISYRVAGRFDDPTATLQTNLNKLDIPKYSMSGVAVRCLYADHRLHADMRAQYDVGAVTARALVSATPDRSYQLQAQGRNMALSGLPLPLSDPVQGVGAFDLLLTGSGGRPPMTHSQVQVSRLRYDREAVRSLYAQADSAGKVIDLKVVRADDPKAFALASGIVDLNTRRINLSLEADDINLAAFRNSLGRHLPSTTLSEAPGRPAPQADQPQAQAEQPHAEQPQAQAGGAPAEPLEISGAGYLRGRIRGTIDKPLSRGRLSVFNGRVGSVDVDSAELRYDLTHDELVISEGTIRQYPGLVRVSGLIVSPFDKDPGLSLSAHAENLDLVTLLDEAGIDTTKYELAGDLSAEVQIGGAVRAPTLLADNVALDDATISGLPITNAAASVDLQNNVAHIAQASVGLAGGTVTLSGTVAFGGDMALKFSGSNMNLTSLEGAMTADPLVTLDGLVSFSGEAAGTTDRPLATFTASTQGFAIDKVVLGELKGTGAYADRQVTARNVTLTPASTPAAPVAEISKARYDLDSRDIAGTGQIESMALEPLREVLVNSSYSATEQGRRAMRLLSDLTSPLGGDLSGTVTLAGSMDEPVADVVWDAHDIEANAHRFSRFTGSAQVTKEAIVVPSPATPKQGAQVQSPDLNLEATGKIVYGGQVQADLSAYNVNLSFLRDWLPAEYSREASGTGDLFMVVSGTTADPVLDISTDIRDLVYRGERLDRLDIDHATAREGLLHIDTIRLLRSENENGTMVSYTGSAGGSIGFTWSAPFIPEDAKLDLHAEVPRQSLALVSAFAPKTLTGSTGTFEANGSAEGTRSHPQIKGKLAIVAPTLRFADLGTGFKDVDAVFSFQGDRFAVDHLVATSQVYDPRTGKPLAKQAGGPVTASGSIPIVSTDANGKPVSGDIAIRSERLAFAEQPMPTFSSGGVKGLADVDMHLSGSLENLTIGGRATVTDAIAALPSDFGQTPGPPPNWPVIPQFQFDLRLANNVQMKSANLDAYTRGDIDITGSLTDAHFRGRLDLVKGYFKLPTARFALLAPGAVTLLYPVSSEETLNQPAMQVNAEDLRARTNLTATSELTGRPRRYTVTITVNGPLSGVTIDPATGKSRLAISAASDPPDLAGSQEAMLRKIFGELGTGVITQGNFGPSISQLASGVMSTETVEVLQPVANALRFESIGFGYDPIEHFSIQLNRQLFGPIYASFSQSLEAGAYLYDLKVSYRFTERYQLSFSQDEFRQQEVLLEGVFKFK